jgi:hypothetical protein
MYTFVIVLNGSMNHIIMQCHVNKEETHQEIVNVLDEWTRNWTQYGRPHE